MADQELTPEEAERERKFYATHQRAQANYRETHRDELRQKGVEYMRARRANGKVSHTPKQRARINFRQRWRRQLEGVQKWRSTPAGRMSELVSCAKQRARRNGLPFNETLRALLTARPPTECACCKSLLDYSVGHGARLFRAPSLDRFNNSKGYSPDNVRVLCWRCNVLKNDATVEELQTIVAYMLRG